MRERFRASPSVRVLQWVDPRGFVRMVVSTTRLMISGEIAFLRPGRLSSFKSPETPERSNRWRQSRTVGRLVASRPAMALLATPSPAKRTIRARSAIFWGVLPELTKALNCFSWHSSSGSRAAGVNMRKHTHAVPYCKAIYGPRLLRPGRPGRARRRPCVSEGWPRVREAGGPRRKAGRTRRRGASVELCQEPFRLLRGNRPDEGQEGTPFPQRLRKYVQLRPSRGTLRSPNAGLERGTLRSPETPGAIPGREGIRNGRGLRQDHQLRRPGRDADEGRSLARVEGDETGCIGLRTNEVMKVWSCGPRPACTSGVTSNQTWEPSGMLSLIFRLGETAAIDRGGPWTFWPPLSEQYDG